MGPRIPIPAHGVVGKARGSFHGGSSQDASDIAEIILDDDDDAVQPILSTKKALGWITYPNPPSQSRGTESWSLASESAGALPLAWEAKTPAGKALLRELVATNQRLDARFKGLGKMVAAVQESIALLERKTRGLPAPTK